MKRDMASTKAIPSEDVARLRDLVRAIVRRFSISERADAQCCGMTVAQAATLEALAREGALRLGRLGQLLGITPSTLSRNLTRLEETGLVRRSPDSNDGRAFRVDLTEKGREIAAELESIENAFAARVLRRLTEDDRERALGGLSAFLDAVRAETESCCSGAFDHLVESAAARRELDPDNRSH
jgi:DNA-binding MarR family transcriptional regulator